MYFEILFRVVLNSYFKEKFVSLRKLGESYSKKDRNYLFILYSLLSIMLLCLSFSIYFIADWANQDKPEY